MTPKNTPQSPITLFLLACAGVDLPTLEQSPSSENAKLVGIGGAIFLTAVMALVSGSFAIYIVTQSWVTAIPAALIYALIIFNLDRFIVSSISKTGSKTQQFLQAVPRIILAIIFAFSISKPLELALFRTEIKTGIKYTAEQQTLADQIKVDSMAALIDSISTEIDTIRNNPYKNSKPISGGSNSYAAAKQKAEQAQNNKLAVINLQEKINNLAAERKKLGAQKKSTTTISNRINALVKKRKLLEDETAVATKAAKEEKEALSGQKALIKNANAHKIKNKEQIIKQLGQEIETIKADRAKKIANYKGLLAEIETLSLLTKNSSAMWWTELLVFLLLMAIEIAPIFAKLMSPAGYYDYLIEKNKDFKSEEIATKNHQLHLWIQGTWRTVINGAETKLVFEKDQLTLINKDRTHLGDWKHLESQKFQFNIQNSSRLVLISKNGERMILRDLQQPNNFMQFKRSTER